MNDVNVCRICIDSEDLIPLFPLRNGVPDTKKILIATGIDVYESDDLPHFLCPACLKFIEEVDKMRKKAEQSDNLLRKLFFPDHNEPEDLLQAFSDSQESDSEKYGFQIEYLEEADNDSGDPPPECIETTEDDDQNIILKEDVADSPEPVVVKPQRAEHIELKFTKVVVLEADEMLPASLARSKKQPAKESKFQLGKSLVHKHQEYVCEICGKGVKRRTRYIEHMNTHNNARPFQCDICPLNFNARANLNRHKLVHTGEKPYKCNQCPNSYRATHHLKYHKLQKHGSKNDIKFKCLKCEKSFPQNFLLTAHMKQHFNGSTRPGPHLHD